MKLRNKKTGEIGRLIAHDWMESKLIIADDDGVQLNKYDSLTELNEEWEDYEETEKYFINAVGHVDINALTDKRTRESFYKQLKEIGNYFETKEEAEKAVEKLKAWKRLKDGGITFKNWTINQTGTIDCFATWGDNIPPSRKNPTLLEDLDLLFGGEG